MPNFPSTHFIPTSRLQKIETKPDVAGDQEAQKTGYPTLQPSSLLSCERTGSQSETELETHCKEEEDTKDQKEMEGQDELWQDTKLSFDLQEEQSPSQEQEHHFQKTESSHAASPPMQFSMKAAVAIGSKWKRKLALADGSMFFRDEGTGTAGSVCGSETTGSPTQSTSIHQLPSTPLSKLCQLYNCASQSS